ncbi:unnamed protein product [Rotaria magnacalcarata]|uniref:Pentatricopeptide repeat-containing protein n=2 Tax=Rotaria magnacalcarata TaxID=392030 RepID=A0A815PXF2_9BILA|nr:unnamed protein product [Rotaria magnacalcarata]
MIVNKLIITSRVLLIAGIKHSTFIRSIDSDLGDQMKILNDNKQYTKTLELFDRHKENIEKYSNWVIIQALKACSQTKDIKRGSNIHNLVSSRLKHDPYILPALIHLYMQCGDVNQAEFLFNTSSKKTVTIYGAMLKGYFENNQSNKAIHLFHEIKKPNEIIITILFNACANLKTNEGLNLVKEVYKEMPKRFQSNPYLLTSLLDAFMKCGDVPNAELLFDKIPNKVLSMYGAMMKGYIENNQANKAIHLFHEIKKPNEIIITILFNACANLKTNEGLNLVKEVYKEMPKSFQSNPYLLTSLLDAFMKCGDVSNAELLFDKIPNKILQMYGAMMKGFIENNQANKAIDLFHKIKDPNDVIFILLFNSCAQLGSDEGLNLTKKVSKTIPKSFYSNVRLLTSLLDALVKCNDLTYAQSLFDASIKNDVGMYAVMMNGYNKENDPLKTLNLFYQMKDKNHSIIYLHVIKALSQIGDYKLSQSIIELIPNDLLNNNQIQTVLIDMWGKSGSIDKVKEIFDKISQPDQYQYAAIINAYGLNGMGIQAIEIYRQISLDLIDEITHICILNACSHSGLVLEARSIFENIQIKTVSIYTTMIDCLSRASLFQEAQNLQEEYERSHPPSLPMYS